MKKRCLLIVTNVVFTLLICVSVWGTDYQSVQLAPLASYLDSRAFDINDNGQIVGQVQNPYLSRSEACLWQNGTCVGLGAIGGSYTNSYAAAINNDGHVVGWSYDSRGQSRACIWQNGICEELGVLPGYSQSYATDINSSGQVVGYSYNPSNGQYTACTWQNDTITDLGLGYAYGINDNGQIVGQSRNYGNIGHACIWQNGTVVDLGYGGATEINNSGVVTGGIYNPSTDRFYACTWQDEISSRLPVLWNTNCSAYDINEDGVVVGAMTDRCTATARLAYGRME